MIRETIAATKPKFIVMMVGLNDRVSIRDRVSPSTTPRAPRSKTPAPQPAAPAAGEAADSLRPTPSPMPRTPSRLRPSSRRCRARAADQGSVTTTTYRVYEFRSDEWAASYTKRIDATIAALKSAGVPVFWVGLPSIRGPKSTSDMQYLDDLYRARAEKAGINYIDVWDGFVDDSGRFIAAGRRLRGPDPPAARRRRRAFHQGRCAQARALSRARNPARDGAGLRAGGAAVERAAGAGRRRPSPAGRPRVRSPARWCR